MVEVAERAVALHRSAMTDPFEVLRHVGGLELAAIVGAILAARLAAPCPCCSTAMSARPPRRCCSPPTNGRSIIASWRIARASRPSPPARRPRQGAAARSRHAARRRLGRQRSRSPS
ncbi:MAG: nicotinate-nucleotide--dimethylbenzimidazole phosphoribosyltransferase [Aliidongia sp.]